MWVADTDRAEVLCFAFSPDGSTLYTGDDEGAVFAWDRATQEGRELHRFPRGADGPVGVWQIVPTPCGTRVLVPNNGRVLDVPHDGQAKPVWCCDGLTDRGTRVSLSADGTRLMAATRAGVVARWSTKTGQKVLVPGALGKYGSCISATYLPGDATVLTIGLHDPSLVLWNATTGRRLGHCVPERTGSVPNAVSPDGSLFAVVGPTIGYNYGSREVSVFDLAKRERRVVIDLGELPKAVAFHPSGKILTTADGSRRVTNWNADTGEKLTTVYPKIGDVGSIAYAPDGSVWCAGGVGRFAVFDVDE